MRFGRQQLQRVRECFARRIHQGQVAGEIENDDQQQISFGTKAVNNTRFGAVDLDEKAGRLKLDVRRLRPCRDSNRNFCARINPFWGSSEARLKRNGASKTQPHAELHHPAAPGTDNFPRIHIWGARRSDHRIRIIPVRVIEKIEPNRHDFEGPVGGNRDTLGDR
jgi:hypothetical protein